jgi:hypothetical protein
MDASRCLIRPACADRGNIGKLCLQNDNDGAVQVGELEQPPGSGWTGAKVIGLIVGLFGMVGFGVCSLCGLAMSFQSHGELLSTILIFSVPGLVLAVLCFLLVRKVIRSADTPPP